MRRLFMIISICCIFTTLNSQENRGVRVQQTVNDLSGEKRVALVIGNSAYLDMPLRNPENDARDFAGTLEYLGFDVAVRFNQNRSQMREAVRDFGRRLKNSRGVGLFFFAGHGIQVEGINYLIPVGADVEQEWEVKDECLEASVVLRQMEAVGNPMNIVILDACRNNPLARSWRSSDKGLARMEAPRGTIILYSTEPGSVANDGDGRNSPFTHHLMSLMKVPSIDFMDVIRELDARLQNETQGKQAPWMEGIPAKFYFLQGDSKTVQPVVQPSATTNRINPPTGMLRFGGGSFNMGNNDGDGDEKPVHMVSVGEFYISPTEITVGDFRQFVSTTGYRTDAEKGGGAYVWDGSQWGQKSDASWKHPYITQTDDHPVTCVSWNDAVAYCSWKSQAEGLTPCYSGIGGNITCNFNANGYRLPTEAEWEYAARGGDNSRGTIYSGSNNVDEVGWYDGNSGMKTHPVGQKKANEMGLYDMTGNVLEWCWDWYDEDYYSSSPSRDPYGPSSGSWRVFRGGSWNIGLERLRCTDRIGSGPGYSDYSFGFRCVRNK